MTKSAALRIDELKAENHSKLPVYADKPHYEDNKFDALNEQIRDHFANGTQKNFNIGIDYSPEARARVKSDSHFAGLLSEQVIMQYLIINSDEPPQFSSNAMDDTKDIFIGKERIECKGEVPIFQCHSIGFPAQQKRKILGSDRLLVAVYGTSDQPYKSWTCGYVWELEPSKIPADAWVDYPTKNFKTGKIIRKFGLYLGPCLDQCTPYARRVMKIPDKIYKVMCGVSVSQYWVASKYGQMSENPKFVDPKDITLVEFKDRQVRRLNLDPADWT